MKISRPPPLIEKNELCFLFDEPLLQCFGDGFAF
jgi:hypothetical protein